MSDQDSTTSSSPSAPHEVLAQIFSMTYARSAFDRAANSSLADFALVNKQWLEPARDVLYSHVYLGTSNCLLETMELFLCTLQSSPGLAQLVRAISFGSFRMERGETKNLSEAIKLCDNLHELRLSGWNDYELDGLFDAVQSKKKLQVLHINRHALSGTECEYFCPLHDFLDMIQRLPELRSMTVWKDSVNRDITNDARITAPEPIKVVPGACPKLRHFDWRSGCLAGGELIALSQIAPALSDLWLNDGVMVRRQHLVPLQLLAMRLTSLVLNHRESPSQPPAQPIDNIISAMPLLRNLCVSSFHLKPATLCRGFANLTILNYRVAPQELEEVISILSNPSSLPALREVTIIPLRHSDDESEAGSSQRDAESFDSDTFEALRALCSKRGIKIRDRFYRNMQDLGKVYDLDDSG